MEKPPTQDDVNFKFVEKDGVRKRLTLESAVSADPESLTALQTQLTEEIRDFVPSSMSELHFTIGHFGKVDELLKELSEHSNVIQKGVFEQELQQLLHTIEHSISNTVNTNATEVRIFKSGAVVLVLNKESVETAQRNTFEAVIQFLRNIGVQDPETYIETSTPENSNLHFLLSDRWTPHLTLGWIKNNKGPVTQTEKMLHKVDIPIQIQPSFFRNAEH